MTSWKDCSSAVLHAGVTYFHVVFESSSTAHMLVHVHVHDACCAAACSPRWASVGRCLTILKCGIKVAVGDQGVAVHVSSVLCF